MARSYFTIRAGLPGLRIGGYPGLRGFQRGYNRRGWGWRRPRWHGMFQQAALAPDPTVQWAQSCLAQNDPSVPQDGILGPQTRQSIRNFQMQQQLPPTGALDSNTMSALQAACSGAQQDQSQSPPPPPQGPPGPPPPPHVSRSHQPPPPSPQMESEIPFDRPFSRALFDFHPDDRWRDRDRRWPFFSQESEGEGEFRVGRPLERRAVEFGRPGLFRADRGRWNWAWDRDRRGPFFDVAADRSQMLWVQSCLARVLGPSVVQDGLMGSNTEDSLRAFQQQQQLPVTGLLDDATLSALRAACGG